MEIRNIAIIAHVDHGKTTLTDAIMKQTGMGEEGVSMDSNKLEQERGITIYAKNTSIYYPSANSGREVTKINIVDTPGHADFGSEVERVLRSIDTVLLVVDAQEGPMPQTRFVLKKSLELGLKPIVVINKIDKNAAKPEWAHEAVLELFMELGANNEQLDFPTIYAIGRKGVAMKKPTDEQKDLTPLLDLILEKVPPATKPEDEKLPLTAQIFNLAYDNFMGRLAICRIYKGTLRQGQQIFSRLPTYDGGQAKTHEGNSRSFKITKLFTFEGLRRKEVTEALAGDIVLFAGLDDAYIGETICEDEKQETLPAINIDEPTISLNFLVNDSPFAGREGKFVTGRQIRERLERELEINVGLKIEFIQDTMKVYGRGELHVAILIENMRREGFELQVSQPQAIIREENGQKMEPYEEVTIDVPEEVSGTVIEKLGKRRGIMQDMKTKDGQVRMIFEMPTRGLLGFKGQFVVDTRGNGILCSRFIGFKPYAGDIQKQEFGSMISMMDGKALAFALWNLQERGILYITPGTEVYEGMIIGNVTKGEDMDVNPIKGKNLTNVRKTSSDEAIYLTPAMAIDIEKGLEIMGDGDYLEVTPLNTRLRKKYLTKIERARAIR
ncbi:MAG: GTP-binding protein TypA [Candidatus Taylorbacteria bacterium RIFOXYD2_FULL_36_9]|uniref:50S ribosomal subunit assembly factor BipA n=1 Tax=Candidatus Taylorbacteria bacterium RIFOXYD2_FULL_36_9 TaxID=1802338 RepID=A0A1G2PFG0_9BACT|nr:MAG: GTP-binding protein TypA [Candidatus Taylorbacteria bacterium RIFOXYD2_FULL_36_9]